MSCSTDKKTKETNEAASPLSEKDCPEDTFCKGGKIKAATATRFFRDLEMMEGIDIIINRLKDETTVKTSLNIWSAGCSSGEETYSLAIAAYERLKKEEKEPRFKVFGTDINRDNLNTAIKGEYLTANAEKIKNCYKDEFAHYMTDISKNSFNISPLIRKHVEFKIFDMRNRPKKYRFDYIVCSHVMQYYDLQMQSLLIGNMLSALKPWGIIYIEGVMEHALLDNNLVTLENKRQLYRRKDN